ncbi:MAG: hypothetical protein HYV77_02095 [Candidatus Wildermuthbacteria bacterium]|nr:hypothetical protein [Candidatus Wildermuthbacteria bacterium]
MAETPTQQFLPVSEIKQGVLILRDRGIRGVLMVSSQNFALKSQEEQDATIYQFQNFLNSLDFPLQITMQSRRLNITGYLDYIKNLEAQQTSTLLQKQTEDYRKFISQLISSGSILAKSFFVVVPFSGLEVISTGSKQSLLKRGTQGLGKISDEQFERMRSQLWQRMEYVALGLRRAGLHAVPLNTEELIELLWSWHHPQEAEVGYFPSIPPELIT